MKPALYVGCLCRIVQSNSHPEWVGRETFIAGRAYGFYAKCGYEWVIRLPEERKDLGANSYHLEPIRPADLESDDEIKTLWEPSPEVIRARNANLIAEQLANIGMRRLSR